LQVGPNGVFTKTTKISHCVSFSLMMAATIDLGE